MGSGWAPWGLLAVGTAFGARGLHTHSCLAHFAPLSPLEAPLLLAPRLLCRLRKAVYGLKASLSFGENGSP